jgi:hypothetical protein
MRSGREFAWAGALLLAGCSAGEGEPFGFASGGGQIAEMGSSSGSSSSTTDGSSTSSSTTGTDGDTEDGSSSSSSGDPVVGSSSSGGGCDTQVDLLFLDDGSGLVPAINTVFADAGINVRNAGRFDLWPGVFEPDEDVDVVFYFNASNYTLDLTQQAHGTLDTFVREGGVLVRTEWTAYNQGTAGADAIVPVDYAGNYASGGNWQVMDAGHPLATDLPAAPWAETTDCSLVTAHPGADVIVQSDVCGPALTVGSVGDGYVVHLNSTLSGMDTGGQLRQILANLALVPLAC